MAGLVSVLFVLAVIGSIVAMFVLLARAGAKIQAAEDAALTQLATQHGLTVRPSGSREFSASSGEDGALRMSTSHDTKPGNGSRDHLRLVARSTRALPAIVVRNRELAGEVTELSPSFHELSTGDAEFDARFVTSVEDDAAARALLDAHKAELASFSTRARSGLELLKLGSEVVLMIDTTFERDFFKDGRADRAMQLVKRLATGAA
ncbi:MAG TPA: hypothetical protein VF316_21315 [Polyangiaceae bacterium]